MSDAPATVAFDGGELRVIGPDDVTDAYVDGLNDPDVHRFLETPRLQRQTRETVEGFVRANVDDAAAVLYGIYVDGVLRGTVRLHQLRPGHDAEIGIALFDRRVWGRSVARRAIAAASAVAEAIGATGVVAAIVAENEGSQRAFAAAGFVHDVAADHVALGWHRQIWRRPAR